MGHQLSDSQVGRLVTARVAVQLRMGVAVRVVRPGSMLLCALAVTLAVRRRVVGPGDGPAIQMCRAGSPTGHAAVCCCRPPVDVTVPWSGAPGCSGVAWSAAGLMSRCRVLFCRASVEGRVESSLRTPKVVVMAAYNAARTLVRTYRDIPRVVDHVILSTTSPPTTSATPSSATVPSSNAPSNLTPAEGM
jgi:hypothetical protein